MVEDTLFSGESKNIEYKVTLPDKSEKYMKTIVAFANTQGGKLIVGVENSLLYFLQSPLYVMRFLSFRNNAHSCFRFLLIPCIASNPPFLPKIKTTGKIH